MPVAQETVVGDGNVLVWTRVTWSLLCSGAGTVADCGGGEGLWIALVGLNGELGSAVSYQYSGMKRCARFRIV